MITQGRASIEHWTVLRVKHVLFFVLFCLYQGQSHASVATWCSLGNGACPWPSLPWQLPAGYNNSLESETIQAHYCSNRLCLIVPVSPLWLACLMTRAPGSISLSRFFPLLQDAQRHRLASCLPLSDIPDVDLRAKFHLLGTAAGEVLFKGSARVLIF